MLQIIALDLLTLLATGCSSLHTSQSNAPLNATINANLKANIDVGEVRAILQQLKDTRSVKDVEKIVYATFCLWFGVDTAGPRKKYHPIAVKVWGLWCTFNQQRSPSVAPFPNPLTLKND